MKQDQFLMIGKRNNMSHYSHKLAALAAKKARLNHQYHRIKILERKQDTREKIQLGGLIKKAKLEGEPTAILLGLLLEAAETLRGENANATRDHWQVLGDIELSRKEKGYE